MRAKTFSFFDKLTPTQFIILGYVSAITIATCLLLLPISVRPGIQLSFIDALFTATSSVSVTGLTVVNTADTFTFFGSLVLLVFFQVGGIGIMTLGTFLWLIFGRSIHLSHRQLIMIDQNRHQLSGLVRLMKLVLLMALMIEAIGTVLFTAYFYISGYAEKWTDSLYYGVFHTISAYTNSGFDLFGNSLQDFSKDVYVQAITMGLIILGAIGFPILIELREYLFGRHQNFRFSLFTKVTSFTFFALMIVGAAGIWLAEKSAALAQMSLFESMLTAFFQSVTVRSGGFSTIEISQLGHPAQFIQSILMFIGASPSSVGGGIRTTTFAIIVLALIFYALGKQEVRIFTRSIKQEDIMKSFIVFTAAAILVISCIITLTIIEEKQTISLNAIIFEATSAFGTTGLSMGITSELTAVGKSIIMLLMFSGRIGILSLLFIFRTKKRKDSFKYPAEELIIG